MPRIVKILSIYGVFLVILSGPHKALFAAEQVSLFLPFTSNGQETELEQFRQLVAESAGSSVSITTAEHWFEYQQGIRAGKPGIYLAPPHFAAWAIHNHGFQPLIRLAGSLSYVIAVQRNDAEVFEMNDLAGQTVCSQQPLNLDYLLVNRAFDNPLLSAQIKIVPSAADEMKRATSDCRGFSVTNQQYEALSEDFPERFIRVQQSAKYNNVVLIVDLPNAERFSREIAAVRSAFISDQGRQILAPILQQWAPRAAWINASVGDYPSSYFESLKRFWR